MIIRFGVRGSGFRVQGYGGGFAANIYEAMPEGLRWQFSLVPEPSPRGEGAPKGRIGHWRHERQVRKAERCAAHGGKRESLAANGKDFSLRSK